MSNTAVSVQHAWERVAERKLLLQAVSSKPATALEWSRGKLGPQPSPARTGGASAARVPAASLRPPLSAASKIKLGTAGRDDGSTSDMPSPRVQLRTPEGKCIFL